MISFDKNYLNNLGWQGMGNSSAQIINILSLPVITRLFSPSDIGLFRIFIEGLVLFTIFMSLRVEQIILLPKTEDSAKKLFGLVFSSGLISSLLIVLLIVASITFQLIPYDYVLWSLALPVTAFLLVLSQAAQQLSQRSSKFKLSGISEIINRFSYSFVAIFAGLFNLPGVFLGVATGTGFLFKTLTFHKLFLILRPNLFKNMKAGLDIVKKERYSKLLGSIIFSNLMLSITTLMPLWFISYNWGADFLGYYSLVLATLVLPITLIGKAVGQVYYQKAANLMANSKSFNQLFKNNVSFLALISLPLFLLISLTAQTIYPIFFGAQWSIAGEIAQFYVIAAGMSFVSIPLERSALVINAWWYGPLWYLLRVITTIITIWIAYVFEYSFINFMIILTLQISAMHFLDLIASFLFSLRDKPFGSKTHD